MEHSVEEILTRCRAGDTEAFGEIYDIFLPEIYRFILYKVHNKELAEDLTEDTFLKAFKEIHSYKDIKKSFSAWLYKIASNRVIDHIRKESVLFQDLSLDIADESMNTQKNTSEKINFEWIQKALLRLPETQREAVILKFINEKTTKEIAEYLEKTETAVRVLISRGIKTLQEVLKDLEKRNKKT